MSIDTDALRKLCGQFVFPFLLTAAHDGDDVGDPSGLYFCDESMYRARIFHGTDFGRIVELLNAVPELLNEIDALRKVAKAILAAEASCHQLPVDEGVPSDVWDAIDEAKHWKACFLSEKTDPHPSAS